MGKIKRVLRCYNCGAVLQSKSKEENGFVPQKILDNNSEDLVIYCQRCFDKMRVINTGALDQHIDDETFKILDDARALMPQSFGLLIYLILTEPSLPN